MPAAGLRGRCVHSRALRRLQREAGKWRGEKGESLKLAAGCALAADHPGLTSEKLAHEADLQMCEAKAEYLSQDWIGPKKTL